MGRQREDATLGDAMVGRIEGKEFEPWRAGSEKPFQGPLAATGKVGWRSEDVPPEPFPLHLEGRSRVP